MSLLNSNLRYFFFSRKKKDDSSSFATGNSPVDVVFDFLSECAQQTWSILVKESIAPVYWNFFVGKGKTIYCPNDQEAKDVIEQGTQLICDGKLPSLNATIYRIGNDYGLGWEDVPLVLDFGMPQAFEEEFFKNQGVLYLNLAKAIDKNAGTLVVDFVVEAFQDIDYRITKNAAVMDFCTYVNWVLQSKQVCVAEGILCFVYVPVTSGRGGFVPLGNAMGFCAHPSSARDSKCWADSVIEYIRLTELIYYYTIQNLGGAYEKFLQKQWTNASICAAIGSIMSRNGSHNIGSHVLSALSHNVGTMPDDRVLYQYIQHRMDYIATATTDFPNWRQPTMFLGTMMKTFLSQRHLLDHIAASEGLRAWKFQGRSVDAERSSVAKIKFHIRRILEEGKAQEVLSYKAAEGTVELDDDVALAIPGGTVGQHAFFTIIENVIRNAAKHDWSSPPSKIKDKGIKVIDSNGKVTKGNLEIFIDYKDIPEKGNVEFTIFANMSDANEVLDASNGKTIFDKVEQAVAARFIEDGGTPRRANWGIAEMKISAGYLQSREPGVIGGLGSSSKKALADNDCFGPEIIEPVRVKEDIGDVDGIEHLGYRFKVAKPRTLLIVVDKELEELTPERKKNLAALGVYIKTKTEVSANEADNSFEFVLIDSFAKEQLTWLLPFRIVCVAKRSEMFTRIREVVATLEDGSIPISGETAVSIAETLLSCRKYQIKNKVNGLLTRVSACWIGYLKRRRMITGQYNLVVNVEVQSNGSSQTSDASGQSLVNEAAAVSFVFEEGFKNVVEGFKELYKVEYAELEQILDVLMTKARKVDVDQYVKQSDDDCRKLIKMQMGNWLKDCNIDGVDDMRDFLSSAKKEEEKDCPLRKFVDYLEQTCKQAKGYLGKYSEKIVTLPEHFIAGRGAQPQRQPVKDDANVIEHILPSVYTESNPCGNDTPPSIKYIRHFKPKVATSRTPENIKNGTPPDFVTKPFCGLGEGPSVLYIEPLSGTQSYLTQIQTQINKEDGVFKAKLVENALLRILIVDERVSKFISDHSDSTLATLSRMSIFIADDKAVTETLEAERDGKVNEQKHPNVVKPSSLDKDVAFTPEGLVRLDVDGIKSLRDKIISGGSVETLGELYRPFKERFDILIIHQGILDKWFRGVVDDESMSSALYDSFKKVFSYVVITTGRGTPANIPNMARVLPFSTIETTLFRKYPEKLILIDAIMNILPHKKMNGDEVS